MTRFLKATLTALLAVAALMSIGSTAHASVAIGASPTTTAATGPVTLSASGLNIICTVRLNATINSRINKTVGATIGSITSGTISACNPSTVTGTVDNTINILYRSFSGVLPNISGITATTSAARFTLRGFPFPSTGCQYTSGSLNATFTASANVVNRAGFNGSVTSSTSGCPTPGTLNATSLTVSPGVTLTLLNS